MSDEIKQIYEESLSDNLVKALCQTREEPGLSIETISYILSQVLATEEFDSLIVELLDRQLEKHPLGRCVFCGEILEEDEFNDIKGAHKKCIEKEIENKIKTDFVEDQKPRADNDKDF